MRYWITGLKYSLSIRISQAVLQTCCFDINPLPHNQEKEQEKTGWGKPKIASLLITTTFTLVNRKQELVYKMQGMT